MMSQLCQRRTRTQMHDSDKVQINNPLSGKSNKEKSLLSRKIKNYTRKQKITHKRKNTKATKYQNNMKQSAKQSVKNTKPDVDKIQGNGWHGSYCFMRQDELAQDKGKHRLYIHTHTHKVMGNRWEQSGRGRQSDWWHTRKGKWPETRGE